MHLSDSYQGRPGAEFDEFVMLPSVFPRPGIQKERMNTPVYVTLTYSSQGDSISNFRTSWNCLQLKDNTLWILIQLSMHFYNIPR